MRPEDAVRLTHMLEAAEAAMRFVESRVRGDLERDELLAFGLARALEIFGEAASKVAPETRGGLAKIPWAAITGMRNRLAHAYHDINFDVLWGAATKDLPELLPALRSALDGRTPPR
jgi:uncharacterized protein with HEPN domain